ncbi:MAG: hypothetical protein COB22_00055 [Cycloclasticus sp.]|nr:MAG: hypothetical protein COB22_00055 [Cycloclasticus sp.]
MRLQFFFPKQQIHILKTEDLRYAAKKSLKGVCNFLNVSKSPCENIKEDIAPLSRYIANISEKEWQFLHSYYHHEIERLNEYYALDSEYWLDKPSFQPPLT